VPLIYSYRCVNFGAKWLDCVVTVCKKCDDDDGLPWCFRRGEGKWEKENEEGGGSLHAYMHTILIHQL